MFFRAVPRKRVYFSRAVPRKRVHLVPISQPIDKAIAQRIVDRLFTIAASTIPCKKMKIMFLSGPWPTSCEPFLLARPVTQIRKNPQKSTKIRKNPQKSAKIRKNPQKSTKIRTNPQKSAKIRKHPQKSAKIRKNAPA